MPTDPPRLPLPVLRTPEQQRAEDIQRAAEDRVIFRVLDSIASNGFEDEERRATALIEEVARLREGVVRDHPLGCAVYLRKPFRTKEFLYPRGYQGTVTGYPGDLVKVDTSYPGEIGQTLYAWHYHNVVTRFTQLWTRRPPLTTKDRLENPII